MTITSERPVASGAAPVADARAPVARSPTLADLTFLLWAFAVPLLFAHTLLNTDGDLGRHLRMGRYIMDGGLFGADFFSHTRYGAAFLQTEWLSQVLLALAHAAADLGGVAVLCGLVIGSVYAITLRSLQLRGVDPLLAFAVVLGAALLGAPHWLARPHLFTMLGVALTFAWAESPARRAWLLAPLFVLWANLHPGFVIGIALLAAYGAGHWLESRRGDGRARAAAKRLAIGGAIALGASLLNPQGPGFLLRIVRHVRDPLLIGRTAEFMSPNFHEPYGRAFLLALLAVVLVAALRATRIAAPRLAAILLMTAAALYAQRNIPLFALVVLPILALEVDTGWRRIVAARSVAAARIAARERRGRPWRWSSAGAVALVLLAASGTRALPQGLDPARFPIAAVERARTAGLDGRLFHEFTWGGYLLLAWPEQRIFIDGMTDFFGAEIAGDYLEITSLAPGWERQLEAYGVDTALVRTGSRLAVALEDRGWHVWHADDTATILLAGAVP